MKKLREPLIIVILIITVTLINSALVYFENQAGAPGINTLSEAFWYMFVTLTTVGYGDLYPASTFGRFIGYIYVFSSLGVLGYLFSAVSNKIYKYMEEKKLGFKGTSFENHILIIGWNDFSRMVAEEITLTSQKMAIVTNDKDDIDLIYSQFDKQNTFVLYSDYQSHDGLPKVNANKASVVFISLEDDSEALMYVLDFRKRYPDPCIVVSLLKPRLKETFQAAGVTYAVARSDIASKLVASYIFEPDVAKMNLELLSTSRTDEDYDVQEYQIGQHNPLLGKNCLEVFFELKKSYDAVLMGIYKHAIDTVITNPGESVQVENGDYLVVLSNGFNKRKIQLDFKVHEGRLTNG